MQKWYFFFLAILLALPHPTTLLAKPKAAELVSDGQVINLKSPRYQELFSELTSKHGFSQAELQGLLVESPSNAGPWS